MSKIAYFDNAATTYPKPDVVYDFADSFYRAHGGNAGRGENAFSMAATSIGKQAKDNLKKLYGCPARKVCFTASATDALNRIILGSSLRQGDHVYITPFEHNAVTRPLHSLSKAKGIDIKELSFDSRTLLPNYDMIEEQFRANAPRMVIMTHASNVCGAIIPVLEIAKLAKKYEATVVIDMSQTCGLVPLELASNLIDFAVFAGHKTLYGPFGIGGFFCLDSASLDPVFFGGNGINSIEQDMPRDITQMTEIGSQNVYAIAGLCASTDWLLGEGILNIKAKESQIVDTLISTLCNYESISIVGSDMECDRVGVVSTTFEGYSPDEVEMILNKMGVSVRSGLHCAPSAHRFLGTLPAGTVRLSVGSFTSSEDFDVLNDALLCIEESF